MKTHSKWLSFGLTAGLLVVAALVTERGAWSIDPQHPIADIDKMIEGAKTESDHEALAAHYEAEARPSRLRPRIMERWPRPMKGQAVIQP